MLCSFIIPAYNASKTIVRCLDSIYKLSLSESDFEVICIDDCSSDNTINVINEYAKSHSNITLLRQTENHRQGAARNRGVDIAKGKYIIFVDSDDESDRGVVEALTLAENNDLDMVVVHCVNVNEKNEIIEREIVKIDGVFTGIDLQTKYPYWGTAPWPYIYKKTFLNQVNYPFVEDVIFEDSDFVNVHLYYAKRMMFSASCAYKMYYNASSTTHTQSFKHVSDYLLLGTRMLKFYHSLEEQNTEYALSIKEGGSYNIWMACKRLIKLSSTRDVKFFYERVDFYTDRTKLFGYREPAYCWTWWTRLCLKHKNVATFLISIFQLGYKLAKKLSNLRGRRSR